MNNKNQTSDQRDEKNQHVCENTENIAQLSERSDDVDKTIDELAADKKQQDEGDSLLRKVFAPFAQALGKLKRVKIGITVRVTAVYLLMTALALTVINLVLLVSTEQFLREHSVAGADLFLFNLRFIAVVVSIGLLAAVCAIGFVSAYFTLAPIRRMLRSIRQITSEDMSKRLEEAKGETELKELAVEINKLLQDLEETFTRQRRFVSNVSHEFKTPIAVVKGEAELLLKWGKDDPAILQESLQNILQEADNLDKIATQSLKLVKIGKYEPIYEQVNLGELLPHLAEEYRKTNAPREIRWEGESVSTYTDGALLTECVRTLVDNAVKYSPADSPVLLGCKQQNGIVSISVQDFGTGIKTEDVSKIFDRFYRCDPVRTREGGGLGLGLSICASIVEALGGKIEVQSVVGQGSTFTIVLGGSHENGTVV